MAQTCGIVTVVVLSAVAYHFFGMDGWYLVAGLAILRAAQGKFAVFFAAIFSFPKEDGDEKGKAAVAPEVMEAQEAAEQIMCDLLKEYSTIHRACLAA